MSTTNEITMTSGRDVNGSYTVGTYTDGREVHVYGERGGFAYIAFVADLTWVTKVPASWVTPVGPAKHERVEGSSVYCSDTQAVEITRVWQGTAHCGYCGEVVTELVEPAYVLAYDRADIKAV